MSANDLHQASQKTRFVSVTVISALLGSHAMELGGLFILYFDLLTGVGTPQKKYQVEFGLLTLAFGFLVLVAFEILHARKTGEKANFEGVASTIIVGLIGGLFSILNNTANEHGYLTSDTATAVFYLVAVGVVFIVPIMASHWHLSALQGTASLILAMCLASGIAFLTTGLVQLTITSIGEFCKQSACGPSLESSHFNPYATSFFLSAPMAAGLFAPWTLLTVDPILQPRRWGNPAAAWQRKWLLMFMLIILGMISIHAFWMYWPKHSVAPNGWLHRYEVSLSVVFVCFLLLQMGIVCFAVTALFIRRHSFQGQRNFKAHLLWLMGAFIFGCLFASLVVLLLPPAELTGWLKKLLFVVPHGAACLLTVLSCFIGARYSVQHSSIGPSQQHV